MKKLLLITILSTVSYLTVIGQVTKVSPPKSNLENFSDVAGSMIKKEFIDIGKIGRIQFQILKITNLTSNNTVSGLRIEGPAKNDYASDNIAFLDSDEIDGFLKSIDYDITKIFPTDPPENDVEFNFQARSGFSSNIYNYKGKWSAVLRLDKYVSDSRYYLTVEDYTKLKDIVVAAKAKL